MRKIFIAAAIFLTSAMVALAHGGSSKNVGNAIVFLNQSPISPFVGEPVKMSFALTDNNYRALANLPVTLSLIDTYYGDATKDKTILRQSLTTDANGDFEFDYTFPKENYFDVEISFGDPKNGQNDLTGFLVQPRRAVKSSDAAGAIISAAALGAAIALIIKNRRQ